MATKFVEYEETLINKKTIRHKMRRFKEKNTQNWKI